MIGIYKITKKENGKAYIGQSNNIERRFQEHCQKGEASRIPLDIAIKKYPIELFIPKMFAFPITKYFLESYLETS